MAAYYLAAAVQDPGSVDGAVGYVLRAQEMQDMRAIRQMIKTIGVGLGALKG